MKILTFCSFFFVRSLDNRVPISARASPKGDAPYQSQPDTMLLDDTQHTTYIHNLEQELAEVDSPGLIFAPFAEKVLSVPQSVLYTKPTGTEVVLYTEPTSLTVPEERDNVRKAILESRARARKRSTNTNAAMSRSSGNSDSDGDPAPNSDPNPVPDPVPTDTTMASEATGREEYEDAMEIDE